VIARHSIPTVHELTCLSDCSGAASAGLGWLQRAGYPLNKEELDESYHPHMRYTSCLFQVDPAVIARMKPAHLCNDSVSVAFFFPMPGLETRHFAIGHVEGNRRELPRTFPGLGH
jgi:hypothetical protein